MKWFNKRIKLSSPVTRYRIRRILVISLAWTVVDIVLYVRNVSSGNISYPYQENVLPAYLLRTGIFFAVSFFNVVVIIAGIKDNF